mmetsp:Transcript_55563/g.100035  ORF Transcript_55563/g.100035 Transcript_55563/m.100035 type:complete len:275 (-) Transcript_55563:635-1459(-)
MDVTALQHRLRAALLVQRLQANRTSICTVFPFEGGSVLPGLLRQGKDVLAKVRQICQNVHFHPTVTNASRKRQAVLIFLARLFIAAISTQHRSEVCNQSHKGMWVAIPPLQVHCLPEVVQALIVPPFHLAQAHAQVPFGRALFLDGQNTLREHQRLLVEMLGHLEVPSFHGMRSHPCQDVEGQLHVVMLMRHLHRLLVRCLDLGFRGIQLVQRVSKKPVGLSFLPAHTRCTCHIPHPLEGSFCFSKGRVVKSRDPNLLLTSYLLCGAAGRAGNL